MKGGAPRLYLLVGVIAISAAACNPGDATVPLPLDIAIRQTAAVDLLGPAPYHGSFASKFIVCTGDFSGPGTFTYTISVNQSLPSDRFVYTVTQRALECNVVFATNRRGGPVPSITVTRDPTRPSNGSVLFDVNETLAPVSGPTEYVGIDQIFPGASAPADYSRTLTGFEGAAVVFYYVVPGASGAGGHGGTGTLTFGSY